MLVKFGCRCFNANFRQNYYKYWQLKYFKQLLQVMYASYMHHKMKQEMQSRVK